MKINHFVFSGCFPTSGKKSGADNPCIFPFTHKGKSCAGPTCCNVDNDPKGPWCSTKTDKNGVHITGHYGYCSGSCIAKPGKKPGKHKKLPIVTHILTCSLQHAFTFRIKEWEGRPGVGEGTFYTGLAGGEGWNIMFRRLTAKSGRLICRYRQQDVGDFINTLTKGAER